MTNNSNDLVQTTDLVNDLLLLFFSWSCRGFMTGFESMGAHGCEEQ
jgi:hypothetical protein